MDSPEKNPPQADPECSIGLLEGGMSSASLLAAYDTQPGPSLGDEQAITMIRDYEAQTARPKMPWAGVHRPSNHPMSDQCAINPATVEVCRPESQANCTKNIHNKEQGTSNPDDWNEEGSSALAQSPLNLQMERMGHRDDIFAEPSNP